MSRITRRNWTPQQLGILSSGGLGDLFDNQFKLTYRVTDQEYDLLGDAMTDDEMSVIVTENPTFSERRQMIQILNKYIHYSKKEKSNV